MWRRWRLRRLLTQHPIPTDLWLDVTRRMPTLDGLDAIRMVRLRVLATWFLRDKTITGAQNLAVTPDMRVAVAAQACQLILALDVSYFDGWSEVILYPGAFRTRHERMDDAGIVHHDARTLSGEAWLHGPVVLAWAEVEEELFHPHVGRNVVVHEFAHKLDGLNGAMNGMPPLHRGMHRPDWTRAFGRAYARLRLQLARGDATLLDPYAATNPAEFFAVASEYYITAPQLLLTGYPEVYAQLDLFYRPAPS